MHSKFNEFFGDTRKKFINKNFKSACNKETFRLFKNKHLGETAVLLGSGMTLNKYVPIKNAIHLGVNSVLEFKKVQLDYFFIQDAVVKTKKRLWAWGDNRVKRQVIDYEPKIQKFFGKFHDTNKFTIADKHLKEANALRYEVASFSDNFYLPTKNINQYCMGCPISTIFMPLQFILYAGFKQIILVGCDCGGGNFIFGHPTFGRILIKTWKLFAYWVKKEYPHVNIEVMNPIGLKNIFPEYLKKN